MSLISWDAELDSFGNCYWVMQYEEIKLDDLETVHAGCLKYLFKVKSLQSVLIFIFLLFVLCISVTKYLKCWVQFVVKV